MKRPSHLIVPAQLALLLLLVASGGAIGQAVVHASPQSAGDGHAGFAVAVNGQPVGRLDTTVSHEADSWRVTSTTRLAAPVDLSISKFDVTYTADWQPKTMVIEGAVQGQVISSAIAFDATTAKGVVTQGGKTTDVSHTVSPRTVVLPNLFYAGYEALAARLLTAKTGDAFPIYLAQTSEVTAEVTVISPKRLDTPGGPIDITSCQLIFRNAGGPMGAEVWIDARGRLARLSIPSQGIIVLRSDLSSVMTREERHHNPGDQTQFIPATGFTLAATVTTPAPGAQAMPAVVLIGSLDAVDRDEALGNVPIFGQLAGALADAGFLVVRYDRRGVGQSGGRPESATLDDYALDAGSVVTWLRKRADVDKSRIALVGHGEGGLIALIAAQHAKSDVAGVALLGTSGLPGRELTLLQQAHAFQLKNEPDDSRRQKLALQQALDDAVISGKGWDKLPASMRAQADTPWFRSWLLFDPVAAIARIRQPLLIVQGSLDMQVFPQSAELLQNASRARGNAAASATRSLVVPDVNHLLVSARSGEASEYDSLSGSTVAPPVVSALLEWLRSALRLH